MVAKAKVEPKAAPLVEVRQCQDSEHWQYNCSATQAQDAVTGAVRQGVWLVSSPKHGSHWTDDEEVKDWKVLS